MDDDVSEILYPMAFRSPYGPVTIIPASAMRDNRNLLNSTTIPNIPINGAYYLQPPLQQPQPPFAYSRRPAHKTRNYRRSKTAPARFAYSRRYYTSRTDPYFSEDMSTVDPRWRSYSGPLKTPRPIYRKRRYQRQKTYPFAESELHDISSGPAFHQPVYGPRYYGTGPSMYQYQYQPRPWWYAPSYTTGYPPSTMPPRYMGRASVYAQEKYPTSWRVPLKVAQFIIGAVILGLVLAPASNNDGFGSFVRTTRTHGQIAVVTFVAICLALTIILLLSLFFAVKYQAWRNADAMSSIIAAVLYFTLACVESWYAACYPPYGRVHPEACKLTEWAIAAILAFFNTLLYITDLVLALRTGVSLL